MRGHTPRARVPRGARALERVALGSWLGLKIAGSTPRRSATGPSERFDAERLLGLLVRPKNESRDVLQCLAIAQLATASFVIF